MGRRETWREVCKRQIAHFRAAMFTANYWVCRDQMDRWLDAYLRAREDGTLDEVKRL